MAGYGHGSVTGLDERTLGRIDLLLFDADYPDVDAAVADAWRVAVLASDPRLRDAHDRVRADAVSDANARRAPGAARVRGASACHRVALAVAFALVAVAAGMISTTASDALPLGVSLLPAGVAAAAAVGLFVWLEPLRANGSLWGSRLPAAIHLACGVVLLFAVAFALSTRWDEVDAQRPLPATTGLVLLIVAAAAEGLLWRRARKADRGRSQSGLARITADLADRRDTRAVFDALDDWWSSAGPAALRANGARVRRLRIEVLARLRIAMVITDLDEQFARDDEPPTRWHERRR